MEKCRIIFSSNCDHWMGNTLYITCLLLSYVWDRWSMYLESRLALLIGIQVRNEKLGCERDVEENRVRVEIYDVRDCDLSRIRVEQSFQVERIEPKALTMEINEVAKLARFKWLDYVNALLQIYISSLRVLLFNLRIEKLEQILSSSARSNSRDQNHSLPPSIFLGAHRNESRNQKRVVPF